MQKISGILPSSNRVTSVDLESANPIRPGTPSFGAPKGRSAANQIQRSSVTMTNPTSIDVPRWKVKEDHHSDIVGKISDGFFSRNKTEAASHPVDGPNRDSVEGLLVMPFRYDSSGKIDLPMPDSEYENVNEGIDTFV